MRKVHARVCYRSGSGKRSYDKKGAVSAANLQRRLGRAKMLDIYPCGDHWHLTHGDGLRSRERKRHQQDNSHDEW